MVCWVKWNIYRKITIFGLKMMVKSALEEIFLKFLHAETFFFLLHRERRPFLQNHKFNDNDLHGGIAKKSLWNNLALSLNAFSLYLSKSEKVNVIAQVEA